MQTTLKNKTLFITGASRGIGRSIATPPPPPPPPPPLRAAADGANIVIAAKTDRKHPKLPGTIHDAAAEVEAAGGKALPIKLDIRDEGGGRGGHGAGRRAFWRYRISWSTTRQRFTWHPRRKCR